MKIKRFRRDLTTKAFMKNVKGLFATKQKPEFSLRPAGDFQRTWTSISVRFNETELSQRRTAQMNLANLCKALPQAGQNTELNPGIVVS